VTIEPHMDFISKLILPYHSHDVVRIKRSVCHSSVVILVA